MRVAKHRGDGGKGHASGHRRDPVGVAKPLGAGLGALIESLSRRSSSACRSDSSARRRSSARTASSEAASKSRATASSLLCRARRPSTGRSGVSVTRHTRGPCATSAVSANRSLCGAGFRKYQMSPFTSSESRTVVAIGVDPSGTSTGSAPFTTIAAQIEESVNDAG